MSDKKPSTYLKNPKLPRPGEVIGAGYFVFRRGDGTKRIRPAVWPFEHPSRAAAILEAEKLAAAMPGYQFDVLEVVASVTCPFPAADAEEAA